MLRLTLVALLASSVSASGYKAKAWHSTGTDYAYPEVGYTRGTGSAILFSGGGTRAFTCALGETRALNDMGLLQNIEYMGGVSGGSWFTSAFIYDQRSYSDDERLCPYYEPAALNDTVLSTVDDACLGSAADNHLYETLLAYTALAAESDKFALDEAWVATIWETFHKPFGISRFAPMSLNSDTIKEIKRRNPSLILEEFITPHSDDLPYMVLEGTMISPVDLNPLVEPTMQFVPIDMTPLYAGMPQTYTFDFQSKKGEDRSVTMGGFVEAFAFGGIPLDDFQESSSSSDTVQGTVQVEWPARTFTVSQAAGISSMAPAAAFAQLSNTSFTLVNETMYSTANPLDQTQNMLVGDGGDQDNFGLIGMVRRGVPRIMVFMNSETVLVNETTWDPYEREPTPSDIDGYFPALFGLQTFFAHDPAFYTLNNQIFSSEDFPAIAADLQASDASGYGALAKSTLTTVENALMGVPAGLEVEVLWYYLSQPSAWYDQLPASVQTDIALGSDGPYPDFPHYPTISPAGISLTPSQSNLLSNMVAWTLENNEETLSTFFA